MAELWSEASKKKLIFPLKLSEKVAELRSCGQTIATLNGSFDLMHAGHLQIVYAASQAADVLIVALNTDQSIKKYKNSLRPIIPLEYRQQMMAALAFVDYVTWFEETDPCEILNIIKPDVHVNGSEYGENCIEADTVKRNGGRLHIVPLVPGLSTSLILNKINELSKQEK
jgi:D-glycero-beta-D-manno-heptose 1-phosphate adenylyltransferase